MSDLLKGWADVLLEEVILDHQPGFASGKKDVVDGVAHLRMNNIGIGGEMVLDLVRTVPESIARSQYILAKGDVLVCTTNSAKLVGKCSLFDLEGRFAFSNHLTRLRPDPTLVDSSFLRWSLWFLWTSGGFEDKCKHWVNQSTLPKEELLKTTISLPPLIEQHRIVAKLKELLGKVDACQQRLEKIPLLLKRFRQAVLAAACSGRLTADWRASGSSANSAIEILRTLEVKELPESEQPDEIIPSSWVWARFGDVIGELKNGVSLRPNLQPPGMPILRISAARPGKIDLSDVRYLPNGKEFTPAFQLKDRDLLFTRYNGSLDLLGVCGMVKGIGRQVIIYPDKLMRIRFGHKLIEPEYAEIFFQNPSVHERVIAKSKSSAGQNGVSGSDIKAQAFALPPLAEQLEIVRRVEAFFKLADQLEARYRRANSHVDRLQQAILAKAFRGELVPQDPNDEPASVLLERIRAEAQAERAANGKKIDQKARTEKRAGKPKQQPAPQARKLFD